MSIYTAEIGKGPMFPIILESKDGEQTWGTLDGELDLLNQDLINNMAFSTGVRTRQESLGHRLEELLEEPNNNVVVTLAKRFCVEYINLMEDRIKPLAEKDIDVVVTSTTISISIRTVLKSTNSDNPLSITINR